MKKILGLVCAFQVFAAASWANDFSTIEVKGKDYTLTASRIDMPQGIVTLLQPLIVFSVSPQKIYGLNGNAHIVCDLFGFKKATGKGYTVSAHSSAAVSAVLVVDNQGVSFATKEDAEMIGSISCFK